VTGTLFFFFFCLIILAFSLTKTMAANYLTVSHLLSHRARWQHPHPPFLQKVKQKEKTKGNRSSRTETHSPRIIRQTKERRERKRKQDPVPGARGSLLPGSSSSTSSLPPPPPPPVPSLPRRCIFFHWRRRPSHVGGPQEVEHREAAPLIHQEVPHSPLPLPLPRLRLDPC